MVLVDTVVKDKAGHMIDNLTRDDFLVYEDGVKQDVQSFSRDELPLAVALVIDRSGSVAPYISELRRIAERALQQFKPEDEVALFSFAASVDRVEDLTTDRQRIADGIARVRAGGGTNIIDALYESVSYLAKAAPERRHAIILISDNQPTVPPNASEGETIRRAMESETVVYSIRTSGQTFPLPMQLPSLITGIGSVKKVTQDTGGEIIDARSVASLDVAVAGVISRLRMRYCLGYYPSKPGQGAFHAIVVRLVDRLGKPGSDYFLHARRGYYATADRKTP
jgi:VWFA-related protein